MTLANHPLTLIDGTLTTFGDLADDRLVLVVNVASRCGLAPQYEALEALQRGYGDRGFTVLGLPSNQFLQELGSEDAIGEYCSATWGVTFPMTERVRVNGKHAHPLFHDLTSTPDVGGKSGRVKWNFEKFLVRPDGTFARFAPTTRPDAPEVLERLESWLPEATAG